MRGEKEIGEKRKIERERCGDCGCWWRTEGKRRRRREEGEEKEQRKKKKKEDSCADGERFRWVAWRARLLPTAREKCRERERLTEREKEMQGKGETPGEQEASEEDKQGEERGGRMGCVAGGCRSAGSVVELCCFSCLRWWVVLVAGEVLTYATGTEVERDYGG